MPMKSQCDTHGCSELLCGCPISCLESDGDFHEILRAKDKWINKLLDQIETLERMLKESKKATDEYFQKENSGAWDE